MVEGLSPGLEKELTHGKGDEKEDLRHALSRTYAIKWLNVIKSGSNPPGEKHIYQTLGL